ncbi:MAG: metal ABC transporter ATP-binding protein [Nitriliruptoraceae bacterium]
MPDVAVEIVDLDVRYGSIEAVRDANLTLRYGQLTAIIGPNGSGKSTLLSTISGLVRPSRGSVAVHPRTTHSRRSTVAHVLQSTVANEAVPLTVVETVRMGAYGRCGSLGRLTAEDRTAIESAIERLRIDDLRNRQLHELSGGQRQRVYVAQGLAQRADVLLLDEPITGLDLLTQETIATVVAEERDAGRCVVLTTHDVGTARLADLAVLMNTRVLSAGPPEEALSPTQLARAYGGHIHELDDGTLVLDEPHHHDHRHDDQLRR